MIAPTSSSCYVAGVGIVSPLGLGIEEARSALYGQRSGLSALEEYSYKGRVIAAGRCDHSRVALKSREGSTNAALKQLPDCPPILLARYAAMEAINTAGIAEEVHKAPHRLGIYVGTSLANSGYLVEQYEKYFRGERPPFATLLNGMHNAISTDLGRCLRASGPNMTISSSCASAMQGIHIAMADLAANIIDFALVVGVDSGFNKATLDCWNLMRVVSQCSDPTTASRPFCASRDGFVYAEGAAALVLCANRHDKSWKIEGLANTSDPDSLIVPNEAGMTAAIAAGLHTTKADPTDFSFIHASANGSIVGDAAEARVLHAIFGPHIPVYSSKALYGNAMAASALINLVHSFLILDRDDGLIPANAHIERRDEEIAQLINCYYAEAVCKRLRRQALLTTFGFGGVNNAITISIER